VAHTAGQFGAQDCKRGGICGALGAHNEVDGREQGERFAPQHFAEAAAQAVARHGSELEAGNDDTDSRVPRAVGAPGEVEVWGAPPTPFFPAGGELRAAREAHAAREAFAR